MKKNYNYLFLLTAILLNWSMLAQAPPELIHYNFNNTGSLVPNYASSPPPGTTTGTIMAGLTQGVNNGQCGFALSGNGTSGSTDYINTAWTSSLSGSWSIAFWTNSITPSSTLWYIFGELGPGFRCFTNGAAGANNWLLRGTGLTDMYLNNGAVTVAAHNCFVFDAPNNEGRIYLNGVLQSTVAQTGTNSFVWTGPFKVGGYGSNSNLSGLMDEFRVYARALTNMEVAQIALGQPAITTMSITSCGPYTSPTTNSVYATSGSYTETFISCGGTSTNNISLTVTAAPTLSINATATNICSGVTVSLTAAGSANSFTWNGTGPNTTSISVVPGATSIYTLVGGNGGSCDVTRTISINVTASPTLLVNSTGLNMCEGAPLGFTVSGATTYSWSTGATTSTLAQTPLTNTTYVVYGINGTCITTSTLLVQVSPNPTISLSILSSTICAGEVLTVTANGASVYVWSNGSAAQTMTATPTTNTLYTVVGISNNCFDTKTVNVTVNPSPTVSIMSSTTTVCTGSMVTLTANGASNYTWTGGSSVNPFTVEPTAPTIYTVLGSNGTCASTASVTINTLNAPTINILSSGTTACSGETVGLAGTGGVTYTWSTNFVGSATTVTPITNTTYTLYGKGSGQCIGKQTISIAVSPNPTVTLSSGRPSMCKGEVVLLTASGASTYAWSSSASTNNTISINPTSNKTYTVTGFDANGCSAAIVLTQTVNACLGISGISTEFPDLRVFPNPSTGLFNMEIPADLQGGKLEVFNSTGQLILEKQLGAGAVKLDLSDKAKGVYYLRFQGHTELIKVMLE